MKARSGLVFKGFCDEECEEKRELLETAGTVFLPLDARVVFADDGNLRSARAPGELFAQAVPRLKKPEKEDVALRALALVGRLESECPMNAPSVSAVFRLYCVEELTMAQIARRCRCPIGTVANRLKLIRAKTGVDPKDLRGAPRPGCGGCCGCES